MNGILFVVVVILWLSEAWKSRNKTVRLYFPVIRRKKKNKRKEKQRQFQSFRFINTLKGVRCIEEQHLWFL